MNQQVILSAAVISIIAGTMATLPITTTARDKTSNLSAQEQLGKEIFFDKISDPDWMACATCHSPATGWTGPLPGLNKRGSVYRGAIPQRFGNRKPPSAAYATTSPIFYYEPGEGIFIGGNFWDGRATGEDLGNPAADQARGPFLNPVEQHNYDKEAVCEQVADSKYAELYELAYQGPIDCSSDGLPESYDNIALAIAAYEASGEVNQYSSKYDAYLAGNAELTEQEAWGLQLFNDENKGNCAACHPSTSETDDPPLFTDYTYDNLGVPRNPDNPFYHMDKVYLDDGTTPINPEGEDWVDTGLAGFLQTRPEWEDQAEENKGKQKVPTLRNVGLAQGKSTPKSYGHNGYFKSLKSIIHFYNTRDVLPTCPDAKFTTDKEAMAMNCWPGPEVEKNVNHDELGDLGLTPAEEDAIVAFLNTLSDGYTE